MITRWLSTTYLDGGRDYPAVDCWGLVRVARVDLGYPELPAWGPVKAAHKKAMTRLFTGEIPDLLSPCEPQHGSVAFCFRGAICVHVGIAVMIEGRLSVVDTNSANGPGWQLRSEFEKQFARVEYYT